MQVKTKVIQRNLNPVWNETLQINVDDPSLPLLVRVRPARADSLW